MQQTGDRLEQTQFPIGLCPNWTMRVLVLIEDNALASAPKEVRNKEIYLSGSRLRSKGHESRNHMSAVTSAPLKWLQTKDRLEWIRRDVGRVPQL